MEPPPPATVALRAVPRDASGQPALEENEVVRLRVPGVELYIDQEASTGKGALYLTTRNAVWLNDADAARSLSAGFRSIVIHAIAKDTSTFPHPCIYCQLDGETEDAIRELRFVPTPDISLDGIFAVMNACAALNPDPEDDDDDDGDEDNDDFFWNGPEGGAATSAEAATRLRHLESVLQVPAENGTHDVEEDEEDEDEAEGMES